MEHVTTDILDIAYLEFGPAGGDPVILLHGFPYDAHAYDEAARLLAEAGRWCVVPFLRGYGPTRFLHPNTFRSGQQAALATDLTALMDALGIEEAALAGYDWGGRAACVATALWPERVTGLVTGGGTAYNVQNIDRLSKPTDVATERRHWYWYYLAAEHGRAALNDDRRTFCEALWREWSPSWRFGDGVYARSAASFDNPDFVSVVLHSYRQRIGAVPGDPALEWVEEQLAQQPNITVPTIALSGADDSVDPPSPFEEAARHFDDLRRLTVLPGIGHNLPQEAPSAFARAVLDLG